MALKRSKNKKRVEKLINSLTHNEDIRQDLWVDYLTGTDMSALVFKAFQHKIKYHSQSENCPFIRDLLYNPPKEEFIEKFTENERELMCLFALGYNIGEVCVHLGITQVGVEHLLSSIRSKEAWDDIWLSNDHFQKKNAMA
jgi:DNA-binding NarL/FixJ family response regulator